MEPYFYLDPTIFIEGSGNNEGKIIAYNDDGDWEKLRDINLRGADSYDVKRYDEPAKGFQITASSYYPQARCPILARALEADVHEALYTFQNTTGIKQSTELKADIYPNPANTSSVLNISSKGTISL